MSCRVIEAEGPEGRLFVGVDPAASSYIAPLVCRARFSATLAPFSNEAAALDAIEAAGGKVIEGKG